MADVWDQNTAHYVMSPINSRLEEICERWIVSLLDFPAETAAGFVSGTTIANLSGLCAGRNELLRRRGWDAKVMEAEIPTRYHVVRNLTNGGLASIIVASASRNAVQQNTGYKNFEIVDDARKASGTYLVFLHADVQPQTPDWLTTLLAVAQRPEVGVVGAKLIYPNGAIQHSGIVTGMHGGAGYPGRGLYQSDYWRWLDYTRNVTAVSSACLVTRKQVFESVGGFDAAFHSGIQAIGSGSASPKRRSSSARRSSTPVKRTPCRPSATAASTLSSRSSTKTASAGWRRRPWSECR